MRLTIKLNQSYLKSPLRC